MNKDAGTQLPRTVSESSLARVWARILLDIYDNPGTELSPVVISIAGHGVSKEDKKLMELLDALLASRGMLSNEKVAFTIFPQRLWKMCGGEREALFSMYKEVSSRYRALNKSLNGRGLYFERLVDFGKGPCGGNQLKWILEQYESRKGVRRSMLQAAIFDPARDHVANAQLGFPCLQHISFIPTAEGLVLNAFYATQQWLNKGFGNYLGLSRLGKFMASEMGIPFAKLNAMIGVLKLEKVNKTDDELIPVVSHARSLLKAAGGVMA